MHIVWNALKTDRNPRIPWGRIRFETELLEINDAMPRNGDTNRNSKLFQRGWKGTNDVGQSPDFGKWYALGRHHHDVQRCHLFQ